LVCEANLADLMADRGLGAGHPRDERGVLHRGTCASTVAYRRCSYFVRRSRLDALDLLAAVGE